MLFISKYLLTGYCAPGADAAARTRQKSLALWRSRSSGAGRCEARQISRIHFVEMETWRVMEILNGAAREGLAAKKTLSQDMKGVREKALF